MAFDRNQLRPESTRPPCHPPWPEMQYRDIQMRIGQVMRQHYELPEELPDQLLTLLAQVIGRQEND